MAPKRTMRRGKKTGRKSPAKKTAKLSSPLRRAIKQVVRGEAETKRAAFYQSANNGSSGAIATGNFSDRGWAVQNNTIVNNTTDLLQLIPYVAQGINDYERIGNRVRVQSLNVRGRIRITGSLVTAIATPMTNLDVYLYFLEHVSLKDYTNLRARNDFNQLLDTEEGNTTSFVGNALDGMHRVNKAAYQLISKKKIQLRYGGAALPGGTLTTPVAVANSHQWLSDFNINLTKACPKQLKYPDDVPGASPLPATVLNAPTNAAIFMAVGFVDCATGQPSGSLVRPWLEQTYISELSFKDM